MLDVSEIAHFWREFVFVTHVTGSPALHVSMCINLASFWGANISQTVFLEDSCIFF